MTARLRVSDTNMRAFSAQQRRRFDEEALVHLRRRFDSKLKQHDNAWVMNLVDEGVQRARTYDIVVEREVIMYLELMLSLSPNFDDCKETQWCQAILSDSRLTASAKLARIHEHIMFGEKTDDGDSDSVPQPYLQSAVTAADERYHAGLDERYDTEHLDRSRRQLTMGWLDKDDRDLWMAAYHQALDDLKAPQATSRPDAEVGSPVADPSTPPAGNLVITLVDSESNEPITGASVQVTGPAIERAVSDHDGVARFDVIATGDYAILAMDTDFRTGEGSVKVIRGETRVEIACRSHSTPVDGESRELESVEELGQPRQG